MLLRECAPWQRVTEGKHPRHVAPVDGPCVCGDPCPMAMQHNHANLSLACESVLCSGSAAASWGVCYRERGPQKPSTIRVEAGRAAGPATRLAPSTAPSPRPHSQWTSQCHMIAMYTSVSSVYAVCSIAEASRAASIASGGVGPLRGIIDVCMSQEHPQQYSQLSIQSTTLVAARGLGSGSGPGVRPRREMRQPTHRPAAVYSRSIAHRV